MIDQLRGAHVIDILITGARIYTADPARPWAEAIAIRGNRIAHVGSEANARAALEGQAEEIRLRGGLVLPGLNDSHIHMSHGARALSILNLEGVTTRSQLQERLHEYAAQNPDREWIEGYGTPYEPFLGLHGPERALLDDAVPNRPVFLRAFDYHSGWCNTIGLERAGIDRGTPLPLPNEVVVDEDTGLATGVLKEREAYEILTALLPQPTQEESDVALQNAVGHVNSLGITSVQNMDADPDRLHQYRRLQEQGTLSVRAAHYLSVRPSTPAEYLEEFRDCVYQFTDPWNHALGVKLFIDGVIETKTALLFESYADGSGETGVPDMDPDRYAEFVEKAHRLEMDIATHAIGDRGVHLALNEYERSQGHVTQRRARHRIEHIEVIGPSDIPRFAHLGVIASMQPFHVAPTTDPRTNIWTRLVGSAREPYAFAWRSLLESGSRLSFGSDWSIATPDVRMGLRAALSRTDPTGSPVGGWQPHQAITLAQALDAYTRGAAYVERQEENKGMLRAGMLADVTVFSEDLFRLGPLDFPFVDVALTIVDGKIVHRGAAAH